jgi:hypothetical protein
VSACPYSVVGPGTYGVPDPPCIDGMPVQVRGKSGHIPDFNPGCSRASREDRKEKQNVPFSLYPESDAPQVYAVFSQGFGRWFENVGQCIKG